MKYLPEAPFRIPVLLDGCKGCPISRSVIIAYGSDTTPYHGRTGEKLVGKDKEEAKRYLYKNFSHLIKTIH